MQKSTARARKIVITVNYHYTRAGRRPKLRADIVRSVTMGIVRRLQRHGAIQVDAITIEER